MGPWFAHLLRVVLSGLRVARGVTLVKPAHGRQQQRAILGAACHRPRLVQARGKRDHPVARAHAIGGFDAGDAGKTGWLADGAAGVGARGGWHQTGRYGGGRAARGATRNAAQIPRVLYRPIGRVLIAGPHGEFVAIELSEVDHARAGQSTDHGGIKWALVTAQHLGARRGGHVLGDKNVLVTQWDTRERAVSPCRPSSVCRVCLPHGGFTVGHVQPRPKVFELGNSIKKMCRDFDAGRLFFCQQLRQLRHAQLMQCLAHSITLGTKNKPSSTAGALR